MYMKIVTFGCIRESILICIIMCYKVSLSLKRKRTYKLKTLYNGIFDVPSFSSNITIVYLFHIFGKGYTHRYIYTRSIYIQKYLRYGYLSIISSFDTLQMRHVVFEKIMVSSINSNARYILIMAKIMRRIW